MDGTLETPPLAAPRAPRPPAGPVAVTLDPPLTAALRRALVDCWVAVTNAGGAVGFVPPVTAADVAPVAERTFARLATAGGPDNLLVLHDPADRLVGWVVLESRGIVLCEHWRTLKRVQVHPDRQGQGYGAALLHAVERAATALRLEALHLTVRDGTGMEGFYRRLGYAEVGRIPRALRLAADDVRDEIYMVRLLDRGSQ